MPDLQALITKLGSAEEGSRELEQAIARLIGWKQTSDYPWRWKSPDGASELQPPRWTRSLDASLPGENIICVQKHEGGNFRASHLAEDRQQIFSVTAKTEILARRLAVLKAMAND